MQHPYMLPPGHRAIPLSSLRYHEEERATPLLRARDPAATLMLDLQRDSVLTVTEETDLDLVLDAMFRLGIRVLMVVHEGALVGVVSLPDAQRPRPIDHATAGSIPARRPQVADVMVSSALVPSIDWHVIQQCTIADLAEIFSGSGAPYLLVLEDQGPKLSRVRGLVPRERLERRLTPRLAL